MENKNLTPDMEAGGVKQPVQPETRDEKNVMVCDIQFRSGSKVYFFDPGTLTVKEGDEVIIDTARGAEFGVCTAGNHYVRHHEVVAPLREVLRLATEQDKKTDEENREREKQAFDICARKIKEQGLDMQLVSAEYAFDGSKVLFFFTAEKRVDFRELVKSLASALRTRIELRQIGVRDKAKMVGGLGICGRPFCCREFLDDFQPVSIKMAKTQNLSLNPTKISGTCGRLMCCLNYEQEAYEDLHRSSPKTDSFVDTPDGRGTVTDVNLLRQSVRVRLEKQPDTCVCHKNCDICVLRSGKAKKTDPPVPADFAPISGNRQKQKEERPLTTYLEPVVMRKSAQVLEEARTNRPEMPESEEGQLKRRRRRGGKNHKSPEKPAQTAQPEATKHNPVITKNQPQSAAPKNVPQNSVPKAGNAETAKPTNNFRSRSHRRRTGAPKSDHRADNQNTQ